jgi:uncharacterized protein YdbL (DUF1318 family)
MNPQTITRRILLAVMVVSLTATPGFAADKQELQKRSAQRYPALLAARTAGDIGETSDGMVEAVKGKSLSADLARLVEEENADRRELYKLLAGETSTDVTTVAKRAGVRNFEKAQAGEWLKRDGNWEQKK